jgi:hypothetical protein
MMTMGIKKKLAIVGIVGFVIVLILYLLWKYSKSVFGKLFGWTGLVKNIGAPSSALVVYAPADISAANILLNKYSKYTGLQITDQGSTTVPAEVAASKNVIIIGSANALAFLTNWPSLVAAEDPSGTGFQTIPGVYAGGKRFIGSVETAGQLIIAIYGWEATDTNAAVVDWISQN